MNRLLKLQQRTAKAKPGSVSNIPLNRSAVTKLPKFQDSPSIVTPTRAYLLITGNVRRAGNDSGLPLIPVQLDGLFIETQRVETETIVDFAKTDGKGNFVLAVSYELGIKEKISKSIARITVAGQDSVHRIPVLQYEGEGRTIWQSYWGEKPTSSVFQRLHLGTEQQLLMNKQLELIAVGSITIN